VPITITITGSLLLLYYKNLIDFYVRQRERVHAAILLYAFTVVFPPHVCAYVREGQEGVYLVTLFILIIYIIIIIIITR